MKKSFFKKIISLMLVTLVILSTCSSFVSARYYDDEEEYTIKISQSSSAPSFATVDSRTAYAGDIVELTVAIDEDYALEYILIYWYEDGYHRREKYLYEEDKVYEFSREEGLWDFTMPDADVTIIVYTEEDWRNESFRIDFNETELRNGEVMSSSYRVRYGDEITLTAIPDLGYAVEYLKVNRKELTPTRVNVDGSTEYEYIVDDKRVDIKASFVKETRGVYPIYVEKEDGGDVKLNKVTAKGGEEVTVTVTPDEGMMVDTVLVDNIVIKGKDNVYKFEMSYYPATVNVTFKKANGSYVAPSTPTTPSGNPSKDTWVKVGDYWRVKKTDGSYAIGWKKMGGCWYYLDRAGDMLTGWQMLDGKWYFLKDSGAMATSWRLINGAWYFFKGDGSRATGWVLTNNKWYYMYSDGRMAASTTINGYKLGSDGAWIK